MFAYIIRRCLVAIPTLIGVMLFMFLLFFQISNPKTIARNALTEKATPEQIDTWIKDRGYDKPTYFNSREDSEGFLTDTLFFNYMKSMFTFDFGKSDIDEEPIWVKLKMGVVPSVLVTVPILLFSLVISVFISMLSAMFRNTYIDRLTVFSCCLLYTSPSPRD